jgi:hypothetical protein
MAPKLTANPYSPAVSLPDLTGITGANLAWGLRYLQQFPPREPSGARDVLLQAFTQAKPKALLACGDLWHLTGSGYGKMALGFLEVTRPSDVDGAIQAVATRLPEVPSWATQAAARVYVALYVEADVEPPESRKSSERAAEPSRFGHR